MTSILDNLVSRYAKGIQSLQLKPSKVVLIASLGEKILYHMELDSGDENEAPLESRYIPFFKFPFSYSKAPISNVENSLGTPTGLHAIVEKYGDEAPSGAVFESRRNTGLCFFQRSDFGDDQANLVTTRILRLRGLEPGVNSGQGVDSYDRYIYIHGTNHPDLFPKNISAGCLLLIDPDLIHLYDSTPIHTHLLIG